MEKKNNIFKSIWRCWINVLDDFFFPDNGVISKEALKRLNHPLDRDIILKAFDDLRVQSFSGIEEPTVTVTYSDGETVTIKSYAGPTIIK